MELKSKGMQMELQWRNKDCLFEEELVAVLFGMPALWPPFEEGNTPLAADQKRSSLTWSMKDKLGKPGTKKRQGMEARGLPLGKPCQGRFRGSFRMETRKAFFLGSPETDLLLKRADL